MSAARLCMAKGPQRSVVLLSFLPKREVSCSIEAGHSPVVASLCTPGVQTAVSSIVWLCSVPTCKMSSCLDSLWCWFASQPEAESQALTSHVVADVLASSIASYQCVTHHSSCTVACLCSAMVRRVLLLAIQRPSLGKAACTCRLPCRCQIGLHGTLAATLVSNGLNARR